MARDRSERAIAQILRNFDIKYWKLHNSCREHDFVARWVVISIYSWDCHIPFVSINWLCREQYEQAGFRMWSDGDESGRRSGFLAGAFAVALGLLALVGPLSGYTGWGFGVVGLAAGLLLAWLAVRFACSGERLAFRRFFLLTLLYLPVVLTVLAIDWQ